SIADDSGAPVGGRRVQADADPDAAALDADRDTEAAAARSGIVVVVDQFEEVFTACSDDERRVFVAALCAAARVRSADLHEKDTGIGRTPALVVLGLRADFYANALRDPLLARALQKAQVVVEPMTEAELRRAITEPARLARLDLEDGLVEVLLRDLAPAAGGSVSAGSAHDAGALPLLSHALLATWQRRRRGRLNVADYNDSGGIRGAVAQTADAVYDGLSEVQQRLARHLFLRLVHLADDVPDTRRRIPRTELILHADGGPDEVEQVLDKFIAERRITASADKIEITHDALVHAWPRLRTWIDGDRAWLRIVQLLGDAASAWNREGHDPALLFQGTA